MRIAIAIVIVALFFTAYLRYFEYRNIYFPQRSLKSDPASIGLVFEDVFFKANDGVRLHGWFIPSQGADLTILFCHGNAGNISHRMDKIALLHDFKLNLFIFDYRGYGKSKGTPHERGLYRDIDAAYDHLIRKENIAPENLILYGESLGSAIAIDLAARKKAAGLIIEEGFTSIKGMARRVYPLVPDFFITSEFDSFTKIKKIICAKLIIHSTDDEIVPYSMGVALFDAAAQPKKLLTIAGSHNTAVFDSLTAYKIGLSIFFNDLKKN